MCIHVYIICQAVFVLGKDATGVAGVGINPITEPVACCDILLGNKRTFCAHNYVYYEHLYIIVFILRALWKVSLVKYVSS